MNKTFNDIRENINAKLDHELKYAKDRNDLVYDLLEKNQWIVDLLSKEDVMSKQVKSKKDFLAEDSNLDQTLEQIADYILFPKFDNKEQDDVYEYLKNKEALLRKEKSQIKKIKNKKSKSSKELNEIRRKISQLQSVLDNYQKNYLSESMKKKNKIREKLEGFMDQIEDLYDLIISEDNKEKSKRERSNKLDIDKDYWDKMGFSESGKKFRQDVLHTYEEAIELLKEQLGINIEDKERQKQYTEDLIKYFDKNKIVLNYKNKTRAIGGKERYFKLRKMYGQLVSDYQKTKEILAEVISFQSPTLSSTVYKFDEDTWYFNNDGKEIEISKNLICFSNPDTYKGLIINYYDLAYKYEHDFNSDMWGILRLFEDVVNNTDLSIEEKFVISMMAKDKTRKDIMDEYLDKFHKELSDKVLSTWINKTIPSKLVRTYIESINEWVYTYKLKGKYKKCSSCSEIKLISNDRYFRKDPLGREGFRSNCRDCEILAKNGKK